MSMRWQNVNPCRRTRPCFPPFPCPVPCLPRESSGPSRLFLEDASSASCHGPSPSRHHLERTGMPCKVYQNLLSPGQLPHTQMYQERGRNVKQFPLPSFHRYSAHSYFHLNMLTSLFSSYHLSSSFNWLACPLYSELIQGCQGFRSHGIPGGASLQISRGKFSGLPNSPMLLGQAPSIKKS